MIMENATKSKDDLVSINAHNLTRRERDRFKIVCTEKGITMQDALCEFVRRAGNREIELPATGG